LYFQRRAKVVWSRDCSGRDPQRKLSVECFVALRGNFPDERQIAAARKLGKPAVPETNNA
jgi:hypothetical protein